MDGLITLRVVQALSLTGLFAVIPAADACGPFFPSDVLTRTDEQLLAVPAADFIHELSLLPRPASFANIVPAVNDSADSDVVDLETFLMSTAGTQPELLKRLTVFRGELREYAEKLNVYNESRWLGEDASRPAFSKPDLTLLNGLPAEFELYERGAVAWYAGELPQARDAWRQVLRRPENQRKYRSVWAAYMLGRSYVESDPKEAAEHFGMTRDLAAKGFSDTTGLAVASLGWEARAWYLQKQYAPAIDLYMRQLASGDNRAAESLRVTARAAIKLPDIELAELVRTPLAQQVLVALILAEHGRNPRYDARPREGDPQRLLSAIEKSHTSAAGADRMAWLAYEAMDFAAAGRWAKLAPADSGLALFVRAKLALRDGDTRSAADFLAQSARHFPPNEEWGDSSSDDGPYCPHADTVGQLAILQLGRSRYIQSLDLLVQGDWWQGAAYVAERVLTAEELKEYVDLRYPKDKRGTPDQSDLRYLLARRLVRADRRQEARDYMPARLLPQFDSYSQGLRTGHDASLGPAKRVAGFWQAAMIARHSGLELMGCELYPDFAEFDGQFALQDTARERSQLREENRLNIATADELQRAGRSLPEPVKRFHYRYIATDHAWAAAQLLPDQSDETARILNEAGSWIATRDPDAADRFYKALVRRCGKTAVGKQAAERRWFVSNEP